MLWKIGFQGGKTHHWRAAFAKRPEPGVDPEYEIVGVQENQIDIRGEIQLPTTELAHCKYYDRYLCPVLISWNSKPFLHYSRCILRAGSNQAVGKIGQYLQSLVEALYGIDVIQTSGYLARERTQGLSVWSLQERTIVPAGQDPGPFPDDRICRELAAGNKPGHAGKEVGLGTESSNPAAQAKAARRR
jgi:hypothetical protein